MNRTSARYPVRFMGGVSGQLWWDIKCFGGWLVVKAGRWKRGKPRLPRVYWSPNGTPWHHGARNVLRARFVEREQCVCREPGCTNPQVLPDEEMRGS
jgi:hypothetical protein